ncbi:zinc finger protein 862-like [Glandiceps talaboti]
MYCEYCRDFPGLASKTSAFFVGTTRNRKQALTEHDKSKPHERCRAAVFVRRQPAPMDRVIANMEDGMRGKMVKLFNIAYFVAKEELPFTIFPKLCRLHVKNDCEIGKTYFNDHACRAFIQVIADTMKEDLREIVEQSTFLSTMCDGSTDTAVNENELMYVRIIQGGLPQNKFLSIQAVENAHAEGVLQSIDKGFQQGLGLNGQQWRMKSVGFGADGASVMMGRKNGVAALIKRDVPYLIEMHCVAHRLELGVLKAIKEETFLQDAKDMLQGIYKQYHYSPKALRELREIAKTLEESVLKPVNILGTRWIPHLYRAVKALLRNFRVIVVHFQHIVEERKASAEMQGRAKNALKKLQNFKFLLHLLFLCDVLNTTAALSQVMQKDTVVLTQVNTAIERVKLSLRNMVNNQSEQLNGFINTVQETGKWEDTDIKVKDTDLPDFQQSKQRIVDNVISHLDERFGNLRDNNILVASEVFDVSTWPEDNEQLATFGDAQVNILIQHFTTLLQRQVPNFSADDARTQWLDMKLEINRHHRHLRYLPLWQHLLTDPELIERYATILYLVQIIMLYPMSTACCERGFSAMKRVKTDWRSSLSIDSLDALLRIVLDGPESDDYVAIRALDRWLNSGTYRRRLDLKD